MHQHNWAQKFVWGALFSGVLTSIYMAMWEFGVGPNPSFDLVDLIIDYSPGAVATWAIETLGRVGKLLITLTGIAVWMFLGGGVAFGVQALVPGATKPMALTGYLAFGYFAFQVTVAGTSGIENGNDIVVLLTTSIAWALIVQYITKNRTVRYPAVSATSFLSRELKRRRLMTTVYAPAAALTVGSLGLWTVARNGRDTLGAPFTEVSKSVSEILDPGSPPSFIPAPHTRSAVTPNRDFYTVDTESRVPIIKAQDWSLTVTGLVDQRLDLSYDELLAMEGLKSYGTLQCISNEVGGNLIGTALWEGIPLGALLQRAGVHDAAVDVVLVALGGYSDSIPIEKAMEPDTLLAYSMNGTPLPANHGFPVRAYIPNIYGMKNVKWLREIRVVESDYRGFWQNKGWSDVATVKTTSAIDLPDLRTSASFPNHPIDFGGIAYAGSRGIREVQYRIDSADQWMGAELEQPLSRNTWVRWKSALNLDPGRYQLESRAVDKEGTAQEAASTATHPDGAGGYHRVKIRIKP